MNNFDKFWTLYPRKVAKRAARERWLKLIVGNGLFEEIIEGLERQLPYWKTVESQYIPYPASWLNGERWTDEVLEVKKPISCAEALLIEAEKERNEA